MITWGTILIVLKAHWRKLVWGLLILMFVISITLNFRSCNKKPDVVFTTEEAEKAVTAIESKNENKLKEVLAESDVRRNEANVLKTEADKKTEEAIKNYDNWTAEQLQEEANKRFPKQ